MVRGVGGTDCRKLLIVSRDVTSDVVWAAIAPLFPQVKSARSRRNSTTHPEASRHECTPAHSKTRPTGVQSTSMDHSYSTDGLAPEERYCPVESRHEVSVTKPLHSLPRRYTVITR